MDNYSNKRVINLRAFVTEHGLKGYSELRKAELISLLRSYDASTQTSTTNVSTTRTRPPEPTRPPPPSPQMSTWEPVDDRSRPSSQEMDIHERQKMA